MTFFPDFYVACHFKLTKKLSERSVNITVKDSWIALLIAVNYLPPEGGSFMNIFHEKSSV